MAIKNLFSEKRKVMSQKSISDLTGDATPVESSDYIDNYLIKKERFLPPINFATASNFAKFGSAKQYSVDAVQRIHNTYPYDGSLSEKITWLNSSNFYDLYIFNHRYPRTCGYAVFSPLGWGSRVGSEVNDFGYPDSVEYIQLKGGPHPDPSSGSLKLSRQFPTPYEGKANLYDATTGISRESNLALDVNKGVTTEFWFKYSATTDEKTDLASKTSTQVLFDLWNGKSGTTEGNSYGRLISYTNSSGMFARWHSGSYVSSFQLSPKTAAAVADGDWHHIAITTKVVPYGTLGQVTIEWNDFIDGQWSSKGTSLSIYGGGGFFTPPTSLGSVTGSMIANLGAARIPGISPAEVTAAVTAGHNDGFGKLSGSLDEFRYWKTARTPQQISRFWNTQIGGGSNTDNSKFSGSAQPVDLGVYYKFNEGNIGDATADAKVLDYSGRISNGTWTGYMTGSSRIAGETASAMIESSASVSEFKDPIIYSSHPDVSALSTLLSEDGEEWDLQNNMALYHTMPEWITSEDQDLGGEQLKKLTQIIASYLDTTYLQIQAIPSIAKNQYPYEELILHDPNEKLEQQTDVLKFSNSPVPFAKNLIEDFGMGATEIFAMADELATLGNRDEQEEFEQKLYDIKNTIYQNIYNNLTYIYKSKGTEKSFRNLIRCYGVDDELIKINLYVDGATYSFSDSDYRSTAVKNKYINFNDADRTRSTIYQSASYSTSNSISYIPGWNPSNALTAGATGSAMTFEADVVFPRKFKRTDLGDLWYEYPHLTSSIFGCHTAQPTVSDPEDFAWATGDSASFQVYALRDIEESQDVRFMLTSSNGSIPTLTSDLFQEVYDNERWLFAVKVYPESPLEGPWVSAGGADTVSGSWTIELQGYNPLLDQIQNSFSVSASILAKDGTYFMNANKRLYAGAHRINFSGSLDKYTDIKIGSVRVWDDYLSDFEVIAHAKDPTNFGRERSYKNSYLFNQDTTPSTDIDSIPQFETLLLNWTFENVTGSTAGAYLQDHYDGSAWDGSFEVLDHSSGSDDKWEVGDRYKHHYTGRGDWFLPEDSTSLVDTNYLSVVKTNLPEVSSGEDMISILDTDDNYFTRDSKPVNHYFAIEKSMYQTISEEMLNIFATTMEFNNLVGEPVNRYRQEYKSLGKLREAFFRKVGNSPDFNKYVNFYKWIDGSLTDMLMQLVPMSANFSDGIKTMVESHILERNKYWNKFPTLEMKAEPIVGRLKGINELSYDWEHGHPSYTTYSYATSKSIEFVSGSSHYIDFGDQDHWTFGDESDDSPFSISCWIKFDDLDTTNMPYYIMGKNSEYRIAWGNSPATGGGQGLYFVVRDFTGAYWLSKCITKAAFKTLVTEDSWHHLTFVYDGDADGASDISIYIDGALWGGLNPAGSTDGVQNVQGASHGSYVAMHNTTNEFQVGRLGGYAGDYFDGHMDELAMFAGALTAAQAALLYNDGYPVDIAAENIGTLAAYWKLGDGDDTGASGIKDSSGNNRHGTVSSISSFSSDVFWAGPKPPTFIENKNCLWWKDRSEASASFTAGNQVDTDRNVLRRILTSDVTTNKILATGEYTDPTNYPNSGFPNAAEFNLAQDGANLAARTQYKGSTYALRSFSKPYKLESEETVQIHGGINYHANKRRELTKHWAVLASPMGAYISLAPGYTDDLEDCADVIEPSKKQFHSFAIDPGGSFLADPMPEKGAHFAPFNFVSSSVTTNASLSETGIDIVNLHDDSYGNTNERPMQGPFTERHVGGMAHRHQDINDTTHTSVTRTENFRITNLVKDVGFTLVAGDYKNYNTRDTDQPFDRFYRDGVAKRPVNIRNILTTTDSALSQSALGNYESEIQILNTHNEGGTFLAKMQAATGSDGFYTINSPNMSLVISDTADTPKLLAVGKTLLDSSTALLPPYSTSQFSPYLSKNKITERFSAPGDPSTAGDAFGGFGIDKAANKYSVYNALPWRNRQVRFPTNALLAAHTGKYGSFSGSALGATDVTTAATASFHKAHRNTDYVVKYVDDKIGDAGTTYCAQRFDNYYVQHPIPANDFGYAWITASADHSDGCELLTTASFITASIMGSARLPAVADEKEIFYGLSEDVPTSQEFIPVDFAGLNTNIYEPVSSSSNILGYPNFVVGFPHPAGSAYDQELTTYTGGIITNISAGVQKAQILNGLLLHRNGPYGYPSWKQIRGGNHPIVREHKKSNIHSLLLTMNTYQGRAANTLTAQPTTGELGDKHRELRFISNLVETPVSTNHPLVHRVETVMDGIAQELTIRHTYANNLVTFANPTRRKMVDRLSPREQPRQTYDDFKDMYLSGDEHPSANPVKGFKSLIYTQTIYPKLENTYLSGSRARLAYAETAAHISQSKNGEYRTFWKDNLEDRNRGEGALNSMGYPIYSNINQATGWESSFISNYVLGSGTLSIWPLDVGLGTQDHLVGYSAAAFGFFVGSSSLGNNVTLIPPSSDEFGGTWGELNRDPNATLFGSLTTAQLNTLNGLAGTNGYTHFMNDDNIICHATASQCIDFYDLSGISWQDPGTPVPGTTGGPVLGGYPLVATTSETQWLKKTPCTRMGSGVWSTAHWAGRNPWYDSYEDYSDDIRPMAKDHTILPEFKISDHIEYYINNGGFKNKRNTAFLNLPGSSITSSATGGPDEPLYEASPYNENFFKEYSHSDFMKDFEVIQGEHDGIANASIISLKCSAVKKLLPYDGFYPVQRCLQLGGIMSASYGPYLSGSASSSYGPAAYGNDPNYKHRAERLQSFLQPFYAPGIMYNSIKSGIAVDYPIHTSPAELTHISTWDNSWLEEVPSASLGAVIGASSSHHVITSDPDLRIPFEALIDPNAHIATSYNSETNFMDRAKMYLTAPYYGSSSFYAQWLGNSKPNYRFAINNFAAEVPNFFLKNKNLSSFRSKPQSQFTEFTSGSAYYMDVVLQKTPDFIMNSHYNPNWKSFAPASTNYFSAKILSNPHFNPDGIINPPGGAGTDTQLDWGSLVGWGYGPKYHVTGTITSDASVGASGSLLYSDEDEKYTSVFFNAIDPSFAVHAPPYLYGRAVSRMTFKPHEALEMAPGESARFSLDKIISHLKENNIENQLEHGVGQTRMTAVASRALKKVSGDPNSFAAKDNVMSISSSINLFGTTNIPQIEYDAITGQPLTALATGNESEKSWVIHTKWETPALNFANGTGGPHSGVVESSMVLEDESAIRNVTGSWWEANTIPSSLKRPLGMWKGYGSVPTAESGIKLSLKESDPSRNANGTDIDGNKISSLIEACGFQSTDIKIGELAEYKIISEAIVAIPFVDIEGERQFFALGNTITESRGLFDKALSSKEGPGTSVINLAKKIPNYILPPHLDFLNDEAIEPFAMYIFEFTHKLSQQDLSNIWQNAMPDIAVTAEKTQAFVTHETGENEFFRGNKIPDNVRWMVFKAKRRSASNYFKMTADTKDDSRFNFLNYISDQEMERYNYNWPYDFFSLIELAKLDAKIGIGDDAFPMPPVRPPRIGSTTIANTIVQGIPPLIANPTIISANNLGSSLSAVAYNFDTGLQAAQAAATQTAMASPLINSPLLNAIKKLGPTGGNN